MNEEQIRQKARVYTNKEYMLCTSGEKEAAIKDFIAGAHSRDEEIAELKEEIESLKENDKELFEGFKKRGTKLGELMKENVKLRNPWISVEERLPRYCTIPSTEQYIKNRKYWDSKVLPIYLVMCSDPQEDYYQFANFLKFPKDKKPSWVFAEDDIKRNCVTHWMPIPQIEKGEL